MPHWILTEATAPPRLNPETSPRQPEWRVGDSRRDKDTCGHLAESAATGARLARGGWFRNECRRSSLYSYFMKPAARTEHNIAVLVPCAALEEGRRQVAKDAGMSACYIDDFQFSRRKCVEAEGLAVR